jgi:hypothetical protein
MKSSKMKVCRFTLWIACIGLLLGLNACINQPNKKMDEIFTLTGNARNGKGGALVVTPPNEVYYIEGLDEWPADLENKTVLVSGKLKVDSVSEEELTNEKGEMMAGKVGTIRTIQNAEWKVLESR